MTVTESIEVIQAMRGLPPEKVDEVKDFVFFLRDKYVDVDYSDEWSDEDMRDFAAASAQYFEASIGVEEDAV